MRDDTMALHKIFGLSWLSRHGGSGPSISAIRAGTLTLAAMLAVGGCASGGASPSATNTSAGTGSQLSSALAGTAAPGTTGQALTDDIPPGRGMAEGGGGPKSYTFREEWRAARAEAQKWRAGAYLIIASGEFVNDDGVPNSWTLDFIDKTGADAVLIVEIDPWGKTTSTREVTGGGVSSFVGQYDKRIPYNIIDSDTAVGLGKAALASKYDLAKTKDPRLGLSYSQVDGSGPYWTYTLFNNSTAEYVSARINALTGAVLSLS